jgi:glycine/D-amino acid oxidase-like deaminating enzyme
LAYPWPRTEPSSLHRDSYREAAPYAYWLDTIAERALHPPLEERREADLVIVGGGFTGLWAALYAKELDPSREVVVLEATRCGAGASSRNGGFLNYSLTHGIGNGLARFEDELERLERLGMENFDGLERDLVRLGVDASFELSGELHVALEEHQLAWLAEDVEASVSFGQRAELLDAEAVRSHLNSPLYLGAAWYRSGAALVNPARLVDGLRQAAVAAGVTVHEYTSVEAVSPHGRVDLFPGVGRFSTRAAGGVRVTTPAGLIDAERVLLATSAYPAPLRTPRAFIAPVYDYALMSEPLSASQLQELGWSRRQGVSDIANQFHYYRLSADNRILWGGYDAVYRFGGPVGPQLDTHDHSFDRLAQHFGVNFPQLRGLRFTHAWGGAIDTCSRFSVFFGRALGGRVAYALGYTGLGVGASRFGGRTALDLLDGRQTEATQTRFVRTKPLPFPPEPVRSGVIKLTQNRMAAADRDEGRRGRWLRALDRAGLGFDS